MRNSVSKIHTRDQRGQPDQRDQRHEEQREAAASAQAFDMAAARYDAEAARNPMMRWLRRESLGQLVESFSAGDTVLEIGCGTGEEALALARRGVRVVATDASPAMIEVVSRKVARMGRDIAQVEARVLPVEHLEALVAEHGAQSFDGAYSSLGALNCTPDLGRVAVTLSRLLRPGSPVVLSFLGKYCLWETLWYLASGRPRLAVRRWSGEAQGTAVPGGPGLTVYYWPVGQIERQLAVYFDVVERRSLPWALPPTYAASWLKGRRRLFTLLDAVERRTSRRWPFYALGDHVHFILSQRY